MPRTARRLPSRSMLPPLFHGWSHVHIAGRDRVRARSATTARIAARSMLHTQPPGDVRDSRQQDRSFEGLPRRPRRRGPPTRSKRRLDRRARPLRDDPVRRLPRPATRPATAPPTTRCLEPSERGRLRSAPGGRRERSRRRRFRQDEGDRRERTVSRHDTQGPGRRRREGHVRVPMRHAAPSSTSPSRVSVGRRPDPLRPSTDDEHRTGRPSPRTVPRSSPSLSRPQQPV